MAEDGTAQYESINLSEYADPQIEGILLNLAAGGDALRLMAIKDELRREEARGWCSIIYMSDDIAVVRWIDQFVITVKDATFAHHGGAA